jgi:hypothetical protein
MSRWPSEQEFASWLGLYPDNRISGGKVLKRATRQVVNRTSTTLRLAAWDLLRSQRALGGTKFRWLRSRLGAPKAITAMARNLACLFYRPSNTASSMSTKGWNIIRQGIASSKSDP